MSRLCDFAGSSDLLQGVKSVQSVLCPFSVFSQLTYRFPCSSLVYIRCILVDVSACRGCRR